PTPCFTDTTGTFCSLTSYVAVRGTGNSKFTNETANLLFISLCNTSTGKTVTTPLFANSLAQYFWQYDNQGLRLLQLRFYQVGSTVPTGGNPCGESDGTSGQRAALHGAEVAALPLRR